MRRTMPHVFSPSQLHVWDACERKWGWRWLAGYPKPTQAASAQLGERVDALMRAHYASPVNVAPPATLEGAILMSALEHMPKHGTARVGGERKVHTRRHVWFTKTDIEELGCTHDLKTTSDLRYAMKPEQLARDPQAILYAQATAMLRVQWTYALTKGPTRKALPVVHQFTPAELAARIDEIDARADRMQSLLDASTKDVLALKPNFEHCGAYGGCPYQEQCQRTTKASSYTMNDIMSMFGGAPAAPAPAPVPVQDAGNFLIGPGGVPGGPVVMAPNGMPLPPAMVAQQMVPNFERTAPMPIRPVTPEKAEHLNVIALQWASMNPATAPAQINPPEQHLPPAPPAGLMPPAAHAGIPADVAALMQAPTPAAPAPVVPPAPQSATQVAAPEPAKRTRKTREANAAGAEITVANGVVMIVLQDPALAKAVVDAIAAAQIAKATL